MKLFVASLLLVVSVTSLTCEVNKTYVKFRKQSSGSANEESWVIKDGATVVYQSPALVNNELFEAEQCITPSSNHLYTLDLLDTYGDGWTAGTWLEIIGEYGNVFFKTMELGQYQETYTLSLYYAVKKNEQWKMATEFSENWMQPSFSDASWTQVTLGGSIPDTSSSQYFRKSFTGLTNMAAYELSLNYKCGIVVYINGVEVYRDNMNESTAAGCYSTLSYRNILRPASEIAASQSLLAVELHFMESSANPVDFNSYLAVYAPTLLDTECYILNDGVSFTLNMGSNKDKSFDWDYNSYANIPAIATTGPLEIDYTFSKSIPYVNGIRIWPYSYPTYAISDFNLSGKEGSDYSSIMSYPELSYVSKVNKVVQAYLLPSLYKEYRMTVYSSVSTSALRIYELHLLVCKTGYPTSIVFESESYTKLVGFEAVNIKPVIPEFKNCTISPALPEGLTLNSDTCTVSGILGVPLASTTYTMTSNVIGLAFTGSFTLEYVGCAGQVIDLYRIYKADSSDEIFDVVDATTQQVVYAEAADSTQIDNQSVHKFLCLTGTKYTINVSGVVGYWKQLSWLYVRAMFTFVAPLSTNEFETLVRPHYDSDLGLPNAYDFYPQYAIPNNQNWYYKMSEVPTNWYAADTSGWTEKPSTGYPVSANQIQLYKKTFNVADASGAAVVLNIRYKYGCIVYLNNHEVFRNGVTGTLSTSSLSTNVYTETRYHQISLPVKTIMIDSVPSVNNIVVGQNTIAIALVANSVASTESVFDAAVRVMGESWQSRYLEDITFTKVAVSGTSIDYFASFFRGNSYYYSSCSDNNIDIEFANDRREWVSSLIIQLHISQSNQHPRAFVVKARNPEDGDNWTTLKTVTGMTWSQLGQQRKIYLLNNNAYNQYRFENFSTQDPDQCYWKFNRIDLVCDAHTTIPDLAYEHSTFSVYRDIEMAEEYVVGEYYMDFTVSPALPQGIVIDPNSGTLSGTTSVPTSSYVFTVTAKKYTGETTSTTLTINVEVCTGGKSLITLVARTDTLPAQCSYKLYQGKTTSGPVVDSIDGFAVSSALNYADFCVPHDIYTLELRDNNNNGWSNPGGYYLTVDTGSMKFEMGQVPNAAEAPVLVTTLFSSYLPFQMEYDEWKILKDTAPENWASIDFDDSAWSSMKLHDIGTAESVTVYARRSFTIPNVDDYHVLNIHIKYAGGVVAYFNGYKVARFNLPEEFDANTESIAVHDSEVFSRFHVVLNMVNANPSKNVMAFEIHRPYATSSTNPVVFGTTGVFGVNDCSIVVDSFSSITGTDPSGTVTLEDFFDLTPVTFGYLPNTVGSYMEWTVENLEGSRFNSYAWQTVFSRSNWGFSLYSRMASDEDYITTIELIGQTSVVRGRVAWEAPLGIVGYKQFRYEVDVTPTSSMSFSAHFFQYCKPSGSGICPGVDDYPPVGPNQISPGPCPYGFVGYSYRTCLDGVLGSINYDHCKYRLPANLAYENARYTLVKDVPMTINYPTYDYIIINFRLHEGTSLPAGLTLDAETGLISGTPTEEIDVTTYTIYGENPTGAISTNITLSVRRGECPADGNFLKTFVGETAVVECSQLGSYVGTQRRACVLGAKDGEWQATTGTCLSTTLIIIIAVFAIIFIGIVIFIISRSRRVKAVGGVKGKKTQASNATVVHKAVKV